MFNHISKSVVGVFLLASSWCIATLDAQILEPDSLEVAVELRGKFDAYFDGEYGGSITVGLDQGSYGAEIGETAGWIEFGPYSLTFRPGVSYSVSVDSEYCNGSIIQFSAPPGFRTFINDIERTRIDLPGGTTVFSVRIESNRGGPFGAAASLRPGPSHTIWAAALGNISNGRSAGVITLLEPDMGDNSYGPISLSYENASTDVEILRATGGVPFVRQVYAYNGLLDISADNNHAFRLKFYQRIQVGSKVNGFYVLSGDPLYEYLVENAGYPSTRDTVRITRTTRQGGGTHDMWTQMVKSSSRYDVVDWCDKPPGATIVTGSVTENKETSSHSSTWFTESRYKYKGSYPGSEDIRDYKWQASTGTWELDKVSQAGNFTSYTYANGRVATEVGMNLGWAKYDYYSDFDRAALVHITYKPYMDVPETAAQASTTSGEVTTYDYDTDWTGRKILPKSVVTAINSTTTAKTEYTYATETVVDVSRNYSSTPNSTMNVWVTTRKDYYDSTHYLTTVTKTYRTDADPQFKFFPGLPRSEKRADGTMTMHLYFRGTFSKSARTFTGAKDGPELLKLSFNGTTNSSGGAVKTSHTVDDQTQSMGSDFYVVPGASTASGTIMAADGTIICTLSYICTGTTQSPSWQLVQREVNNYTDTVLHSSTMQDSGDSGSVWSIVAKTWTKGRIDTSVDELGVRDDFTYDANGRVYTKRRLAANASSATIPSLVTTYETDAVGRITRETLSGTATSETLTTSRTFDRAGRLTSETKPGYATTGTSTVSAVTTTNVYDDSNRKVTTTLPTGSTTIEIKYRDGQLASRTGTGIVAEYYTYGVETNGRRRATVNLATSSDSRKRESWVDMLGRNVKSSRPGFTGQVAFEETSVYDDYTGANTGRLLKSTKTGYAPTLYAYNTMSQLVRSGLDIDGNSAITLASTDRVTDNADTFEYVDNAWWSTNTSSVYPFTGGSSGTASVISITRKRVTGLSMSLRSETRTYDARNNETRVTMSIDAVSKVTTTTTKRPGMASDQVEKALNGLPIEVTGHDGLTIKKRYDGLARLTSEIQPRTGTEQNPTVKTTYHTNTTWPKEVKDAANKRLSFTHYDGAGRPIYGEDAYGKTNRTAYTARGETENVWGTATYPVSYVYNAYGERTTMRTYQEPMLAFNADSASWPGQNATPQETSWEFDTPSGLLKKKTDARSKFTEYTYNARGQMATRMWARTLPNSSTRVTTTYSYWGDTSGEAQTGELKGISYNDNTPSVSYTYSRLGQIDVANENVTGDHDFVYNSTYPMQLDAEVLGSFYGTRSLTRTYETSTSTNTGMSYGAHTIGSVAGRMKGLQVGTTATPANDLELVYETSNSGRLAGLVSKRANGAASRKFLYGYETNSALLKTLAIDGSHPFTITRTFETNRDLITDVETKWSTTSRTKFAYAYDEMRRRQSVVQSGDVFSDYGGTDNGAIHQLFEYNGRSELTTAATFLGSSPTDQTTPLSGRRHEFAYDVIGNRKSSNTSGAAAVADQYVVNSVNQYTARENNTLTVGGVVDAAAKVAAGVDAVSLAGRAGKHWGDNVLLPNGNGPFLGSLKILAAKAGAGSGGADLLRTETRTAFIPPAWQTFTYDDDGNILSDGVWTYTWDAENRLIIMENPSSVIGPIPSASARRLEFQYDYLHRRVQKLVLGGWNGSTYAAELSKNRYLYNGWNLVAEFSVSGSTLTTVRSYTWGLDIARTLTDAAGVGALVQVYDYTDQKDYLPSYDGNGNVAALFDATNGTCVAGYEYSPFGELLRTEGTYALKNPFRFSTKFTDDETGLVYYGRRYYSPGHGRFLGRDPIEEAGGLNLYGFCRNNSVNYWDVLGNVAQLYNLEGVPMELIGDDDPIPEGRWTTPTGGFDSRNGGWGLAAGTINPYTSQPLHHGLPGELPTYLYAPATFDGNLSAGAAAYLNSSTFYLNGIRYFIPDPTGRIWPVYSWDWTDALRADYNYAWSRFYEQRDADGVASAFENPGFPYFSLQAFEHLNAMDAWVAQFSPMPGLTAGELLNAVGRIWSLPNSAIGLLYGGTGYVIALIQGTNPGVSIDNNAIQFTNITVQPTAMTIGNVIVYGVGTAYQPSSVWPGNPNPLGIQEMQHTFQGQVLGVLYLPAHLLLGAGAYLSNPSQGFIDAWHGPGNVLETGPHDPVNPGPWP